MLKIQRLSRYNAFREGKKRVMVSTDLMGRGVDYGRVNLVFHYDFPNNKIDYHHRVRFLVYYKPI